MSWYFETFLALRKIETVKQLCEKIETETHVTAKKIETARSMKIDETFARPKEDESCIPQCIASKYIIKVVW